MPEPKIVLLDHGARIAAYVAVLYAGSASEHIGAAARRPRLGKRAGRTLFCPAADAVALWFASNGSLPAKATFALYQQALNTLLFVPSINVA